MVIAKGAIMQGMIVAGFEGGRYSVAENKALAAMCG